MNTVNVVAITSDGRPISSQCASFREAADEVVRWSRDPFYMQDAKLLTVVVTDGKTFFKHDCDSDGKFRPDFQRIYTLDTPAESIAQAAERLARRPK